MKKEEKKVYYTSTQIKGIKFNIYSTSNGICKIDMNKPIDKKNYPKKTKLQEDDPYLFGIVEQLKDYFESKRKYFDLPLDLIGTHFQLRVWNELLKIPYGDTASYKDVAIKLGDANLMRAVGRANGTNPVPIIVPCHRVIYSNGHLGGYTGGLNIKTKLLEIEGYLPLELFELN
jgi:O-6-methylguanine DNA methyltransferase